MKHPVILDGPAFDWAEGERYAQHAVDDGGNVNWMAVFFADPGVMSCPGCGVHLWAEGFAVRCPDCGTEWRTQAGARHDEREARRVT